MNLIVMYFYFGIGVAETWIQVRLHKVHCCKVLYEYYFWEWAPDNLMYIIVLHHISLFNTISFVLHNLQPPCCLWACYFLYMIMHCVSKFKESNFCWLLCNIVCVYVCAYVCVHACVCVSEKNLKARSPVISF